MKEHIIQEFSLYPQAKLYIPDVINPKYLSKDYLFSVTNIYIFNCINFGNSGTSTLCIQGKI